MKTIETVFPIPFLGEYIGNGKFKLEKPFEYWNPPVKVKVPAGFITDGASIPRFAWSLIGSPWSGRYARAAIIHDYLYFTKTVSRKEADRIFLQAMQILKVNWFKRRAMWLAVRLFAGAGWNKKR